MDTTLYVQGLVDSGSTPILIVFIDRTSNRVIPSCTVPVTPPRVLQIRAPLKDGAVYVAACLPQTL
jgi:hypothetical protein